MIPAAPTVIALRAAPAEDAGVRRLAALDDAPELRGRVLLALIDDTPAAAISLEDGRVVADPFRPTADAIALLRLRSEHLHGGRARRRRRVPLPHGRRPLAA